MNQPALQRAARRLCFSGLLLASLIIPLRVLGQHSALRPAETAHIDSIFRRFDNPGSPGCIVAVIRNGEMVFGRGYGAADIERGVPLSTGTVYLVGSMTKQFTALLAALLAQEGKLSLDDDIRKYLPELPDYGTPIRVRQLIHHTSGIRELFELGGLSDIEGDLALVFRQRGLNFAPGTDHLYSNGGYALLGELIERATDTPLATLARELIFEPLGMTSSQIAPNADVIIPRRALAYAPLRSGSGYIHFMPHGDLTVGADGLYTTAEDLVKWDSWFYRPDVGGASVLATMTAPAVLANGDTIPYAFGLHTEPYRGARRLWHGGLVWGYRSQLWRFPDHRTSVLVMCNIWGAEPNRLVEQVVDVVLADHLKPRTAEARCGKPADSAGLARFAGTYVDRERSALQQVALREGELQIRVWVTWYGLEPRGDGRFRIFGLPQQEAEFREDRSGRTTLCLMSTVGDAERCLSPAEPRSIVPSALDAYTGTYLSPELAGALLIEHTDGRLSLRKVRQIWLEELPSAEGNFLTPIGDDLFSADEGYYLVEFTRDTLGGITGLRLSTPRAKRIEFLRQTGAPVPSENDD